MQQRDLPARIQLSRAKGFVLSRESYLLNGKAAVKATRPGLMGNPWHIGSPDSHVKIVAIEGFTRTTFEAVLWGRAIDAAKAVALFRASLADDDDASREVVSWALSGLSGRGRDFAGRMLRSWRANVREKLPTLRGANLACWCRLYQPCHADVLLELANRPVCEEIDHAAA